MLPLSRSWSYLFFIINDSPNWSPDYPDDQYRQRPTATYTHTHTHTHTNTRSSPSTHRGVLLDNMAGRVRQPIDERALEKFLSENVPAVKIPIDLKQVSSHPS